MNNLGSTCSYAMAASDPLMAREKLHCSSRLRFSFSVSVVAAPGVRRGKMKRWLRTKKLTQYLGGIRLLLAH
jgi:hypothetical protein